MKTFTRQLRVVTPDSPPVLLKVAFATTDRETVNQHFGSAKSIAIYGVNQHDASLQTVTEFGELEQDGNENKLAVKIASLEDCIAVYCRACGASAVRQLLSIGVQPIKVSEGAPIVALISELQQELREGPGHWLAKALQRNTTTDRFDAMESEGWME
jgi:nitrogen fixation protein NifX